MRCIAHTTIAICYNLSRVNSSLDCIFTNRGEKSGSMLIVGRFKKYHTHTLEVERNFYAASIENRAKSTMTSFVQALKHGLITPYNMISCYYCDQ